MINTRKYFVASNNILGLVTNQEKFAWSYDQCNIETTEEEFEKCKIKIELHVTDSDESFEDRNATPGKYHYFSGRSNSSFIKYERNFLAGKKLRASLHLKENKAIIAANKTYCKLIKHRFMNLHSISYIATDVATLLLLEAGYSSLHCSAFKYNGETVVIFAPPNTGKTLTTMMVCKNNNATFIAEDLAITDGEKIYSVPWTSTFRYYDFIEEGFIAKIANKTNKYLPFMDLLNIGGPTPITQYTNEILHEAVIDRIYILERGETTVSNLENDDATRKIFNLNRYEFNYIKSPTLVAYNYFNPSPSLEQGLIKEKELLNVTVKNAKTTKLVRTNNAMHYSDLIIKDIDEK